MMASSKGFTPKMLNDLSCFSGVLQEHRHPEADVANDAGDDAKARPRLLTATLSWTVPQRRDVARRRTRTRHSTPILVKTYAKKSVSSYLRVVKNLFKKTGLKPVFFRSRHHLIKNYFYKFTKMCL